MKKILLSVLMLVGFVGFAQHTQTTDGFSNNCDEASGTGFAFANYFPSGGGGYDNVKVDTLKFGWGTSGSSTFYYIFSFTNTINLSAPNNVISFRMKATGHNDADTTITASIGFENAANDHLSVDQSITLDQVWNEYTYTFDAAATFDFMTVKKIVITIVNADANSRTGAFYIADLNGGSLLSSTNDASSLVSSSKLFPNPVSDEANIELNLKSASDVKVTLCDMMGREVMTIAEGSMASLNKAFSVATLQKGVYTVNYSVNGAAAKSELLMVK
jgi:hypothetical protein